MMMKREVTITDDDPQITAFHFATATLTVNEADERSSQLS